MKRFRAAILFCLLLTAAASAARGQSQPQTRPEPAADSRAAPSPDPRRAQIDAATADALQALRREILTTPLVGNLTVRQLLNRTAGGEQLLRRIDNAEQRGGTRWRDDQTCEVL